MLALDALNYVKNILVTSFNCIFDVRFALRLIKISLKQKITLNEKKKLLVNYRTHDGSFAWRICNAIVLHQGGV